MDLTFSDDQLELVGLADRILGDHCSPDQLRSVRT